MVLGSTTYSSVQFCVRACVRACVCVCVWKYMRAGSAKSIPHRGITEIEITHVYGMSQRSYLPYIEPPAPDSPVLRPNLIQASFQ